MSAATIIHQAAAEGVALTLTSSGTVKAAGDRAAVTRWAAMIREHKLGIVALLQQSANGDRQVQVTPFADPAVDMPAVDPDVHQRWTVAIPGRDPFGFIVPQGMTLEQVRVQYPTATGILVEPPQDHFPATTAEAAELRQLIDKVLPGAPAAERDDAFRTALTDVQDALTSVRALAADREV